MDREKLVNVNRQLSNQIFVCITNAAIIVTINTICSSQTRSLATATSKCQENEVVMIAIVLNTLDARKRKEGKTKQKPVENETKTCKLIKIQTDEVVAKKMVHRFHPNR